MVRELCLAQPGDPLAERRIVQHLTRGVAPIETGRSGDVDVGLVPEEPARGGVGARLEHRLVQELREQREGRRHRPPHAFDPSPLIAEVGEAADPPIVLGTERVEGGEHAPPSAGGLWALPRGREDERLHRVAPGVDPQVVSSGREPEPDRQSRAHGARRGRAIRRRCGHGPLLGVIPLRGEGEMQIAIRARRRHPNLDFVQASVPRDDHRLERASRQLLPPGAEGGRRVLQRRDRRIHRVEHRDRAVDAGPHASAEDVLVALLDVVETRELPEGAAIVVHGPSSSRSSTPRTGTGSQSGRLSSS
jgi:hypothetical protein